MEREATELDRLERRLLAEFSPPLSPQAIRRHLRQAAGRFDSAHVRTYVMVLIERAAVEELRLDALAARVNGNRRDDRGVANRVP